MSEEQAAEEAVEEVPAEPTAEDRAMENGWRPKEEWQGDPDDWVDAKQFNFRGELMERIKSQNKQLHKATSEIQALKTNYQQFQEHTKQLAEVELKKQLQQLKDVKKQALEENDYDTVVEVDEKVADLKAAQKEAPPSPPESPQLDPEIAAWIEANPWYNDDPVKRGAADAVFDKTKAEYPDKNMSELLKEVGNTIEARFGQPKRSNNNPITASSTGGKPAKRGPTHHDLSDEQRKVGKTFVDSGAIKNLTEYAKQLAEIGGLNA